MIRFCARLYQRSTSKRLEKDEVQAMKCGFRKHKAGKARRERSVI